MARYHGEQGAAAVEFAIVALLLVTLLMGIIEFGYAFFLQGNIAGAAREAARAYAIDQSTDVEEVVSTYVALPPGAPVSVAAVSESGCTPGELVTVTVTYEYTGLTGFFGGFPLTGEGTMRCGG